MDSPSETSFFDHFQSEIHGKVIEHGKQQSRVVDLLAITHICTYVECCKHEKHETLHFSAICVVS